jgi:hypothetical protein
MWGKGLTTGAAVILGSLTFHTTRPPALPAKPLWTVSGPVQAISSPRRYAATLFVGRLFLATLRAVVPPSAGIPLTTLHDIARMTVWAFERPCISQRHAYPVVGSIDNPSSLCFRWENSTQSSIPYIPWLRLGIRLFHPKMAELLVWLGNFGIMEERDSPLVLETYAEWFRSRHPPHDD